MTTDTVEIDTTIIYPYAHAAFCAGYALYGPTPVTEIAKAVCLDVLEFSAANIHDTNILKFAEAKGNQQGLFDALYMRRDRLWMKHDKKSKKWVQSLASKAPKDKILNVIRRFSPLTDEATKSERHDVKQETIGLLMDALHNDPEFYKAGLKIVEDALTEGAAEGRTSATAMIQQLVGKHLPNLDDLRDANIRQLITTDNLVSNSDFVLRTLISGIAGDIALHVPAMLTKGETPTAETVRGLIASGLGSSFYLDGAVHGAYAQSQLYTYEKSGSDVDFLTVGDKNVCPQCVGYEAKNPWKVTEVPMPPVHGDCRCWLAPAGTIS